MRYIITIEEINRRKPENSYWTALSIFGISSRRHKIITCRCKCGVEKNINVTTIIKGTSRSCGCVFIEKRYSIEEINKKIPKLSFLKAVSFTDKSSSDNNKSVRYVLCLCKCGKETSTRLSSLINGHTWSCGCQNKSHLKKGEVFKKKSIKYSQYHTNISTIYNGMIRRCYKSHCKEYRWYGAKGVTVCDEWRNDYQKFLDWALSNGWQKGLQLDKDIKGDGKLYSPETCSFVTALVNSNNKTNTKKAEYNGKILPMSEIAKKENVPIWVIYAATKKTGNINMGVISNHKYKRDNK